jgi:hypothetical protein
MLAFTGARADCVMPSLYVVRTRGGALRRLIGPC